MSTLHTMSALMNARLRHKGVEGWVASVLVSPTPEHPGFWVSLRDDAHGVARRVPHDNPRLDPAEFMTRCSGELDDMLRDLGLIP